MLITHRQPRPITDLGQYRAMRARPVNDLCRWSYAIEDVCATHWRIACAWQRVVLRMLGGA